MSDIHSPEFKRRAAEAARQRAEQEQRQRHHAAVRAAKAVMEQQRAETLRQARERRINGQQHLAKQLAQVALRRELAVNRKWVVAKSHNFTIKNRLQLGNVLMQGWMVRGTEHTHKMDDGCDDTWREELVLTTGGLLLKTHGPYQSDGVNDFDKLFVHKIPHPNPQEYFEQELLPRAGQDPYRGMPLDDVDEALAEFAGVHRLV